MKENKKAIAKMQAIILVAVVAVAAIGGGVYYYMTLPPAGPVVKEVVVGNVMPMSGASAYSGDICTRGLQFAADEINAAGGIKSLGGANISLVTYDAGSTAGEATSALQRMLAQYPQMVAVMQAYPSGNVVACSEITEREEIPMLCQAWADGITQRGFQWLFRFAPTSSVATNATIPALIAIAKSVNVTVNSIGFVYDDNPSSIGMIASMKALCNTTGIRLAVDEMWVSPLRDATPIALKIKEGKPDILFQYTVVLTDSLLLFSKIFEMGIKVPMCGYGASYMNPQFQAGLTNEQRNGIMTISDWNVLKGMEAFEQKWLAKFGGTFVPKDSGVQYGVMYALKEALEIAGSINRTKVRDALKNMHITSGTATLAFYGSIEFAPNGDLKSATAILCQWQGAKILTIYPEKYATGTVVWPK